MSIMYAQMGMALIDGIGNYQQLSAQTRMQESIQEYQNSMMQLSAARSKNAVTVNEIRARDAQTDAIGLIQRTSIQDKGAAAVAAASAGVAGNSVNQIVSDLNASAGRATYAQKRQTNQTLQELGEQRTSISIAAITNRNTQVLTKPSVGSMLLGVGTNLLDIYDSHQPEGSRLFE